MATPPARLTAATLREYLSPGVKVRPGTVMLVLDPGGRSTHVLRSAVGKGQIRKHRLQTSPNMSDPILIGSEVLAGSRPDDSYTQACSRTRSVWPKPDTARIQSDPGWFCTIIMIPDVCGSTQPYLDVGRLRFARTRPDDPCTQTCFQTRCAWPRPNQAIQTGSGPPWKNRAESDAGRQIRHIRSGPTVAARWQ